ncbi:unnamed protein product [Moneuplotes crassus]|uniref:Phosphatidylinositol-4-phosphate 5-kinase n=1 Tax=Euplotes crassus TaxID=5936 RepID=A0AAD1Y409_EUPCR|nr:unnamed protein product [Moneuplotes crassus]
MYSSFSNKGPKFSPKKSPSQDRLNVDISIVHKPKPNKKDLAKSSSRSMIRKDKSVDSCRKKKRVNTCLKQMSPKLKKISQFLTPYQEHKEDLEEYNSFSGTKRPPVFLPKPSAQPHKESEALKKQKENFLELLTYLKNAKNRRKNSTKIGKNSTSFNRRRASKQQVSNISIVPEGDREIKTDDKESHRSLAVNKSLHLKLGRKNAVTRIRKRSSKGFRSIRDIIKYPYQDDYVEMPPSTLLKSGLRSYSSVSRNKISRTKDDKTLYDSNNLTSINSVRSHITNPYEEIQMKRSFSKNRMKKLPKLEKSSEDILEDRINSLTRCFSKESSKNEPKIFLKRGKSMDQNVIMMRKFAQRYEELLALKPATKKIKLSPNQKQFIRDCKKWLKRALQDPNLLQKEDFVDEFKWTQTDDIFKGQHNGLNAQGHGVCFTRTNNLIEGIFKENTLTKGIAKILYSNGEYFSGEVTQGGLKNGKGTYYYSNGDRYDGQFLNDKRIGNSRLIFDDKSEYIGQFIDDEADGHGIYTDPQGNRYMSISETMDRTSDHHQDGGSGHFLRGRLYGKGEIHFKNGDHYSGQFKASKRHGEGTMTYNAPISEVDFSNLGTYYGNWVNDQRHGKGEMEFTDGTSFTGKWNNDEMRYGEYKRPGSIIYKGHLSNKKYHGSGKITLNSGTTILGEFCKGEFPKSGTILFQNGLKFEGLIEDTQIGDKGKLTYKNGDIYEGFFKNKMRNGFGTFLEANGNKYEGRWEKDQQQGEGKQFLKSKKEFYEGGFNSGKRHGFGRYINHKGQLYIGEWNNGKKINSKKYQDNAKDLECVNCIVSSEEYHEVINSFLSPKSSTGMEVKVFQ